MSTAATAMGACACPACYVKATQRAPKTVRLAATHPYSWWSQDEFSKVLTFTYSSDGDQLTTDICKGDTVRVSFEGKVFATNGALTDVRAANGDIHYDLPKDAITLVKKAPPPEPGVGSIIIFYGEKYYRTAQGWRAMSASNLGSLGAVTHKWESFLHSAVRLMTVSNDFVSNR